MVSSEKSGLQAVSRAPGCSTIDGTTNYIQGMDYWCISLAYVRQNEIDLGIIYAPDRDEFFFARRGKSVS
jgi:myo-inositol-1(or 4)-monophosphatase